MFSSLERRKFGDANQLTAEHLLYGRDTTVDYLETPINNIFYAKYVPDIVKTWLLTPVHKKDKVSVLPSNYRGNIY